MPSPPLAFSLWVLRHSLLNFGPLAQARSMKIDLNWKKPLFYLLLPILLILCFVGFPPPFAPPRATKAAQEQSVPAEEQKQK